MYLFLNSIDCLKSHPDNNVFDFTIDLGKQLVLKGKYQCALTEIEYKGKCGDLYVYTDLVDSSYVTGGFLPILRIVKKPVVIEKPYYLDVTRELVSKLRVYIRTEDGELPSVVPESLRCTLRIVPV